MIAGERETETCMLDGLAATRLMVFLSEDDRAGHHGVADRLLSSAKEAGIAGATVWRGVEGFGVRGRLRAARLPDIGRGLPIVVEIIDAEHKVDDFVEVVRSIAPGSLVTTEPVTIAPHSG
jgi:PII-like signaling protein